jgi:hypothetical protein
MDRLKFVMSDAPAGQDSSPEGYDGRHRRRVWLMGVLAFLIAMGFAAYTNHTWEDYYITFKSSKHLATGEGLVHQPGERVHTFTSPLGVLLPALASVLTFNASDAAALWGFRLMCAAAFGGAVVLMGLYARRAGFGLAATAAMAGLLITDAKTVDFCINGMETAWMVLFLGYVLWATELPGRDRWRHLGLAWAGLMWTRPDSFVYIGAYALGRWLFNDAGTSGLTRRQWIAVYLKAGLLTTAVYLPWLAFAFFHYGSPVPHTVLAKSMIHEPVTIVTLLKNVLLFPFLGLEGRLALDSTFLPAYFEMGGWPGWVRPLARLLALVCALVWLAPGLRSPVRACSFTFFCAQVYLWTYPNHPFPWYIPSAAFFAIATIGGVIDALGRAVRWLQGTPGAEKAARRLGGYTTGAVCLLIAGSLVQLLAVARQTEAAQRIVEEGNRKQIGLWLKENAGPGDTVFMEPLGYIGYFSTLKTLDFPGMSSRESVAARELLGNDFTQLISWLEPTWLVLRPREIEQMIGRDRGVIDGTYRRVKTFSVAAEVEALDVPGKPYLMFDSEFVLLRHERSAKTQMDPGVGFSPFQVTRIVHQDTPAAFIHSPGAWVVPVPEGARRLRVAYGFAPEAFAGENRTDGAIFQILHATTGRPRILHDRHLDPVSENADRGFHTVEIYLPTEQPRGHVVLRSDPHRTTRFDYTIWTEPEFLP